MADQAVFTPVQRENELRTGWLGAFRPICISPAWTFDYSDPPPTRQKYGTCTGSRREWPIGAGRQVRRRPWRRESRAM